MSDDNPVMAHIALFPKGVHEERACDNDVATKAAIDVSNIRSEFAASASWSLLSVNTSSFQPFGDEGFHCSWDETVLGAADRISSNTQLSAFGSEDLVSNSGSSCKRQDIARDVPWADDATHEGSQCRMGVELAAAAAAGLPLQGGSSSRAVQVIHRPRIPGDATLIIVSTRYSQCLIYLFEEACLTQLITTESQFGGWRMDTNVSLLYLFFIAMVERTMYPQLYPPSSSLWRAKCKRGIGASVRPRYLSQYII